jgi:predicted DNA-binding transcriptional regulator AlpA
MQAIATAPTPLQFLRTRRLAERWNVNPTTIWRMQQRGELPPPTRLSAGIVAWRSDVIERIEAERTPPNESAPPIAGSRR